MFFVCHFWEEAFRKIPKLDTKSAAILAISGLSLSLVVEHTPKPPQSSRSPFFVERNFSFNNLLVTDFCLGVCFKGVPWKNRRAYWGNTLRFPWSAALPHHAGQPRHPGGWCLSLGLLSLGTRLRCLHAYQLILLNFAVILVDRRHPVNSPVEGTLVYPHYLQGC